MYDRLLEAQAGLVRGADGGGKPLSCSASQLARVAQLRPGDARGLERLLGDRRAERFGAAFLEVLRGADQGGPGIAPTAGIAPAKRMRR